METIAPPVVAVIVTCDPGEWFEETLRAFASQDYPELSILVLDAASAVDPTPRVAAVLPNAFVRRLPTNLGFAASANEVLSMVEGASLLLLCHDDVAPDPDVIHILVEESFRSNAGVVAPKLVTWDDPTRLLHVGMAVDKGGAVVDRIEPGEIDHGQHDAVRDVFLGAGGMHAGPLRPLRRDRRVRPRDLRHGRGPRPVLAGPDPRGPGGGGARGAGAAPGAVGERAPPLPQPLPDGVARRGRSARAAGTVRAADGEGQEHVVPSVAGATDTGTTHRHDHSARTTGTTAVATTATTLQSLQRRHELHAALKAYGPFHLLRVLPQIALLALAEIVVASVAGHRDRAQAVAHAWRWNFAHRRALRGARAEVRAHRRLDDRTVRRLQLHGSARLNAYVRRAVTHGLQAANLGGAQRLDELPVSDGVSAAPPANGSAPSSSELTAGTAEGPATSTRWLVWLAAALVVVFGTRQLFGSGLPVIGQLLPMPSWTTLLHRFVSGWQPTGVGTTDPTTPATGILGLAGMVLFGGMGLLDKVVVLGCIPVGAMGMARLTRPLGTAWARVTSTVIYLAIPVPYDALATAHWDALVLYAACPWIVHLLGQASRVDPYGADRAAHPPDSGDTLARRDRGAPCTALRRGSTGHGGAATWGGSWRWACWRPS